MADATHLLYVLLDSNLPTGGFVASSGLESYAKHGFLRPATAHPYARPSTSSPASSSASGARSAAGPSSAPALGPTAMSRAVMHFARGEIENYHASTGWYVARAHGVVAAGRQRRARRRQAADGGDIPPAGHCDATGKADPAQTIAALVALDHAHETTLLSHVSRRASKTQGIAMLTLHARGLSAPPTGYDDAGGLHSAVESESDGVAAWGTAVVDGYKRAIRQGAAPGHLAVCWGAMTAVLGMDHATALHLYLFTHARSLLSAAVRLNFVGPYLSTQLLSHPMRDVIERVTAAAAAGQGRAAGDTFASGVEGNDASDAAQAKGPADDGEADPWAWADEAERGPATTWPLGEILVGRHDVQHSRVFNS